MADADDTTNLQEQLAAHRATLAVYLRQLANLGADYSPPGVHNGIAEARAAIARLKAALRVAGVVIDDQDGDLASPDEETRPATAPAHSGPASVNIAGGQIIGAAVGANYGSVTTIYQASHAPPPLDPEQAQALLDQLPLDYVPDVAALPPGSRMPLRPNPLFVGREADLKALATALKTDRAPVISTGIGGVGKTQLAVEFAHRYGPFFAGGVFWLSFANPAGVDTEIAACGGAGALELYSDADGLTLAEQVAKVAAAWQQPIPRLLIIDNCDDMPDATAEQQLADRLPSSGGCRVLVTSQRGHWSLSLGLAPHPLGVLGRAESIALLRGYRDDLSDADADAIAETLGDLPLALTLAGSYLATYRAEAFGAPATYLTNLRAVLLDHRSMKGAGSAPSLTNHELNVRATFALSYQRLDAADPVDTLAIALLARAAQLAPGEPFPRELLLATLAVDADDEADADDEDAAVRRADALLRLVALGLLEDAQGGALRIHRLIAAFAQAATQDDAALAAVEQALGRSANAINAAGYPVLMQPILAHLRHATERASARADVQAATLCNNLGSYLWMIGDYAAAQPLLERALAIYEHTLGPQHPATAVSLNNLAGLLEDQGDYAAARPLLMRAVAICERTLGPQHPGMATSLNNLALLLHLQRDYAASQPLYERALAIREAALGPQHPDIAQSLTNLAGLLKDQGDIAAARSLYERALAIQELALGPQHPDMATSLNNLAGLLAEQGDDAAALPLYERALAIREQALGPRHPRTAESLNNLVALLVHKRDIAAARSLLERALGPQHPDTAMSLNNLAGLLRDQGDYAAAQPLFERALAIREQALGPTHPATAQSLNNLAGLLQDQGDYAAARPLFERALAIREQALGSAHPLTANSLNNLAGLLQDQGDYAAARSLLERALAIREEALGPDHPTTQQCRRQLAALDTPAPSAAQQIADITAQAETAVAAALADPSSDRAALAAQLEAVARQAEDGEEAGSPYLALAAHLRALAAQLIATDAEDIDTP
jgi:tetratricopeptide (TPR) repeat protein